MKTEYNINNMMQRFGYRIQDAIRTNKKGHSGLNVRVMEEKFKWWKFWNYDLHNAYRRYNGIIFYDDLIITDPVPEVSPTPDPEQPGVIYAPYVLQVRTEPDLEYNKFKKKYNRAHACCPKCNSDHLQTTLMGYVLDMNHKEDYKDLNAIKCHNCGYRGIYHDLVPKKRTLLPRIKNP